MGVDAIQANDTGKKIEGTQGVRFEKPSVGLERILKSFETHLILDFCITPLSQA